MTATPPPGYELPGSAVALINHAKENGWTVHARWFYGPEVDEPFVHVLVGRDLAEGEGESLVLLEDPYATVKSSRWRYQATWHSRNQAPGRVRLMRILGSTPWHPAVREVGSLKQIRQMISVCPTPGLV